MLQLNCSVLFVLFIRSRDALSAVEPKAFPKRGRISAILHQPIPKQTSRLARHQRQQPRDAARGEHARANCSLSTLFAVLVERSSRAISAR
jgi:hypothetical protein